MSSEAQSVYADLLLQESVFELLS